MFERRHCCSRARWPMAARPDSAGATQSLIEASQSDAAAATSDYTDVERDAFPIAAPITTNWEPLDGSAQAALAQAQRAAPKSSEERLLIAAVAGTASTVPPPAAGAPAERPKESSSQGVELPQLAAVDAWRPSSSGSVTAEDRLPGSPAQRVPTPTTLRKTGMRSDGERTSSPHGTPPAWVSMGERGQWREEKMEQDRAEQDRLMKSLWARDFPEEPPQPLAEGHRLKMTGHSLGGTLPAPQQSAAARGEGSDPVAAALAMPTSPKPATAAGVTVAFAQPLLASGTAKQVVPRPVSPPNRAELSEAATHDSAHAVDAHAPEPFSPIAHGQQPPDARPQTAPDVSSNEALRMAELSSAAVRSVTSASRPVTATDRGYGSSSGGGGGNNTAAAAAAAAAAAIAGRDTARLSAAVTAALMQGHTAPPDPSGLDPMAGFQLLPTNTKPADIWVNEAGDVGTDRSAGAGAGTGAEGTDDGAEIIGLIERIGDGRMDKREESRRNREKAEWQERAARFAKMIRATTAEVDVATRRLQHMGGAEAGLVGEAGQAGKARSAEAQSLHKGRQAIAAAVSRVRQQIRQPQPRHHRAGRSGSGGSSGSVTAKQDELATLRNDIAAAEAALVEHKNDQRRGYEMLRQNEASLTRELKLFAETLDGWEKESMHTAHMHNKENEDSTAQKTSATTRPYGGKNRTQGASPRLTGDGQEDFSSTPEVETFETFLAESGGPSGGWDAADHSTFLSVWSRYVKTAEAAATGTNPSQSSHWARSTRFLASACAALPALAEEVVSEHARWYLDYIRLLDAKRNAIATWRERKRLTTERRRIKLEEQAAREEAGAGPKLAIAGNDPEVRKVNAKKLEEWRARKVAAKKKEIEERQAAEDRARAKRQMEERREKARRAEIMQRREERLAEKERQSELLAVAAAESNGGQPLSSSSRRPSTASSIAQLQARDRDFVMRKKEARIAKQQSLENARRLSSGARPVRARARARARARDCDRVGC